MLSIKFNHSHLGVIDKFIYKCLGSILESAIEDLSEARDIDSFKENNFSVLQIYKGKVFLYGLNFENSKPFYDLFTHLLIAEYTKFYNCKFDNKLEQCSLFIQDLQCKHVMFKNCSFTNSEIMADIDFNSDISKKINKVSFIGCTLSWDFKLIMRNSEKEA